MVQGPLASPHQSHARPSAFDQSEVAKASTRTRVSRHVSTLKMGRTSGWLIIATNPLVCTSILRPISMSTWEHRRHGQLFRKRSVSRRKTTPHGQQGHEKCLRNGHDVHVVESVYCSDITVAPNALLAEGFYLQLTTRRPEVVLLITRI